MVAFNVNDLTIISIHALLWSATALFFVSPQLIPRFQSTHSCGVRHWLTSNDVLGVGISIHALLWSATERFSESVKRFDISIHALLWSATKQFNGWNIYLRNFNPRTPVECDAVPDTSGLTSVGFQSTHSCGVRPITAFYNKTPVIISIHALLWSATGGRGIKICHEWISIHALLWSATLNYFGSRKKKKFQSTHSCGVRRKVHVKGWFWSDFNPRTPVECDGSPSVPFGLWIGISIHALLWSATEEKEKAILDMAISIHALLWSAT